MENNYPLKSYTSNKNINFFLITLSFLIGSFTTFGQVQVPFQQRTSQYTPSQTIYSIKGDFAMIGNTNLTLQNYGDNTNNSNNTMIFVDEDNDNNTYNSSSAELTFSNENGADPSCSNIIYAGLYWTGRGDDDDLTNAEMRTVKFKGPGQSYKTLTANANDINFPGDNDMYAAYIEVTDEVKDGGLGNYWVADVALSNGNGGGTGYYGGWGMVVVYENSKMNWRDVTIFDGYAYVQGSTTIDYELPVSGFNAVQNGDVNVKVGMMAGEGDIGITGDYFKIRNANDSDWVDLSHSGNSTNNGSQEKVNTWK